MGEEFLSHLLARAKCGRRALRRVPRSAGNPHRQLRAGREFSPPSQQGDRDPRSRATRPGQDCGPVAVPSATSCAGFLLPAGQLRVLEPRNRRLLTYRIGGLVPHPHPHPPGAGRQRRADLKAEPGAGAGLSAKQTRLSRSHTIAPRSSGRANRAAVSFPVSSPPLGPWTDRFPLLSGLVRRGVGHALPSPGRVR